MPYVPVVIKENKKKKFSFAGMLNSDMTAYM